MIKIDTFRIEKGKVNKAPHFIVHLIFDYSEEAQNHLIKHGYKRNLNYQNNIVQLPIVLPIYPEEYEETTEYFDEVMKNIKNVVVDPLYAVLQSKNDDLRLKGISEIFLTCFDTQNAIEIESNFGKID